LLFPFQSILLLGEQKEGIESSWVFKRGSFFEQAKFPSVGKLSDSFVDEEEYENPISSRVPYSHLPCLWGRRERKPTS